MLFKRHKDYTVHDYIAVSVTKHYFLMTLYMIKNALRLTFLLYVYAKGGGGNMEFAFFLKSLAGKHSSTIMSISPPVKRI